MKVLGLYRILNYLLLLVAAFLCLMLLAILPAALANPVMLLPAFLIANIIIYSYASFRFLAKGIIGRQYCKPQLRDYLKVTSFVSAGMGFLFLFQSVALLSSQNVVDEVVGQSLNNMPTEANITKEDIYRIIHFTSRFFLVYSLILLTHIVLSYYLLRRFRDVFAAPEQDRNS